MDATVWIPIALSSVMAIIAIITLAKGNKKDTEKEAEQRATMSADMKYIRTSVDEIRLDNKSIQKDVADRIMDEDTYAIGKYPYWKRLRTKVQRGMISEERGMFSLTLDGARILAECGYATVDMMDFDLKGNLFAVGVTSADPRIRIGDEAVVLKNGEPVAVGVAMMSGKEMVDLKRGIAVKVRHKLK